MTKGPISAGRQCGVSSEAMRGQPGRGAGRVGLPQARRGFRMVLGSFRSKAGRKSDRPKKGRRTSDGFDFRVRLDGSKDQQSSGLQDE